MNGLPSAVRDMIDEIAAKFDREKPCNQGDFTAGVICGRLVAERLMEKVCGVCGEVAVDGDCCNYRQQNAGNPITRAQFIAQQEER